MVSICGGKVYGLFFIAVRNARVNQCIKQVGDQISNHREDGGKHEDGKHHRPIARHNRIDRQFTHAGNAVNHLDGYCSCNSCRKDVCKEGDDGKQGVSESMFPNNSLFFQPFCFGGSELILLHNAQTSPAHLPGDQSKRTISDP